MKYSAEQRAGGHCGVQPRRTALRGTFGKLLPSIIYELNSATFILFSLTVFRIQLNLFSFFLAVKFWGNPPRMSIPIIFCLLFCTSKQKKRRFQQRWAERLTVVWCLWCAARQIKVLSLHHFPPVEVNAVTKEGSNSKLLCDITLSKRQPGIYRVVDPSLTLTAPPQLVNWSF